MPDAGSNEVLADPPIGTRFVLSATWDGAAHSKTSNAWQGRITVTGPPALSGSRVRDIARFTDLTWTGGWGVERPITTIASCRTADLRDCMAIYSSVYFPGCNGAAVSPADRGRYLAVSQWLADDRTAFPLVGLTPPVPVGLFVDLRGSVSVTGPVTGTAPGRVPRCAWWRDRLPALTVRRTIDSSESEPPIAQAHCFDNCKFRVYIHQDRVRRSFLASIQPAYKSMRISLPKRLARRLKAGQATVTVLHRGRRIVTRNVKVE